jgi:hypothetical protein
LEAREDKSKEEGRKRKGQGRKSKEKGKVIVEG